MTDFIDPILNDAQIAHVYGFVEGKLPTLPFIAYNFVRVDVVSPDNLSGDERVYTVSVNLELLTYGKRWDVETRLDSLIPADTFTRSETYIDKENIYSIVYEFTCKVIEERE